MGHFPVRQKETAIIIKDFGNIWERTAHKHPNNYEPTV